MDKTLISILGGLGGMFGWGTSDFFASISAGRIGHSKTLFWSQVVGMISVLALIPFFGLMTDISPLFILLVLVGSFFYATAYLFFYKAFEVGNVSVVSATINLYAVFTMLFAFVFLGQRLTSLQYFAVFLIVAGVILVSVNFKELKKKQVKLLAGVKEAFIAAVLFGVFWNLSEILSEKIGWLSTTLFVKLGLVFLLILFSLLMKQGLGLSKVKVKTKLTVALVGILEVIAMVSVNYGIIIGDVILVIPISSALTIVTILMAVIFLKEKISRIQTLGILTAITGIVLTAF